MTEKRTGRGPEFVLGCILAAATIVAVLAALIIDSWREILVKIGAPIAVGGVIGAALIAYDGALSKVRFDAEAKADQDTRKKRAVFVKLDLACAQLYWNAINVSKTTLPFSVDNTPPMKTAAIGYVVDENEIGRRLPSIANSVTIKNPDAVELAWQNLELFDANQVMLISEIRELIKKSEEAIKSGLEVREPFGHMFSIDYRQKAHNVSVSCRDKAILLSNSLEKDLNAMVKNLSQSARLRKAESERKTEEGRREITEL